MVWKLISIGSVCGANGHGDGDDHGGEGDEGDGGDDVSHGEDDGRKRTMTSIMRVTMVRRIRRY